MKLSTYAICVAILLGSILSALLSSALVLAGLRAGITPGVSPLIVLAGWVLLAPFVKQSKKPFLLILQTTGSAGAAVTAGVIFTAPILQIAAPEGVAPAVSIYPLIFASLAGALLGWGCVGLGSRRMIFDSTLPAPEAVACNELLETAEHDKEESRPSILHSLIVPGVLTAITSAGMLLGFLKQKLFVLKVYGASLPLPLSPLYIGIGAILSIETAILLAVGGLGHSIIRAVSNHFHLANDTFRWVGAAAMTISILYTLISYVQQQLLGRKTIASESQLLAKKSDFTLEPVSESHYWSMIFAIIMGVLIAMLPQLGDISNLSLEFLGKISVLTIVFILCALALSAIGAILSLQVGSSASPVSGTVFVGMLCLSLTFTTLFPNPSLRSIVYLLVTLCVAICAANDSSQDYRTMVLQKIPISIAYIPQLCGLLAAVLVVPPTLWLAHDAFYLGSEALSAPQASFFAVVLLSLFEEGGKPFGAIMVGLVIGAFAVIFEHYGKKRGKHFSSVSLCVGLYLPPSIGIGILLGAACRYFGLLGEKLKFSSGVLAAAALISVDAAVTLGFGFANIFGKWAPGYGGFQESSSLSWLCGFLILLSLYCSFSRDSRE